MLGPLRVGLAIGVFAHVMETALALPAVREATAVVLGWLHYRGWSRRIRSVETAAGSAHYVDHPRRGRLLLASDTSVDIVTATLLPVAPGTTGHRDPAIFHRVPAAFGATLLVAA